MDTSRVPNVHYVIEKDDVCAGNVSEVKEFLDSLIESEVAARIQFQSIEISFNGYDEDPREVFEIDEIRDFVRKLDLEFPYWLYFMNPSYPGLFAISMCILPPNPDAITKTQIHPQNLVNLLERRWFPALYHIGKWTLMSESELDMIAVRCGEYFYKGPQKPPIVN